jgi:hypothetical protein
LKVPVCSCGGKTVRVHRTFREKFTCIAVYHCRQCGTRHERQRPFMFYFAERTRCPLCGTERLSRLSRRDGIDPMHWNLFLPLRRICDVRLYHCRFCRIQFYDTLRGAAALSTAKPAE